MPHAPHKLLDTVGEAVKTVRDDGEAHSQSAQNSGVPRDGKRGQTANHSKLAVLRVEPTRSLERTQLGQRKTILP